MHDVGKPPTFRIAPDRIRFDNHVDVGVKMAEEICRRLRFSNDDTEQILALVANHMRFSHVSQMKDSTFKRFVRMPHFDQHLELHRLDCRASHRNLASYNLTRERIAATPPEAIRPAAAHHRRRSDRSRLSSWTTLQGNSCPGGGRPTRRKIAVKRKRPRIRETRISSGSKPFTARTDCRGKNLSSPFSHGF